MRRLSNEEEGEGDITKKKERQYNEDEREGDLTKKQEKEI